MVAIKRSSVPKELEEPGTLVAKLLVVGGKQVGKSAAIVRYTTGRYIQEYGQATSHWLYRHPLQAQAAGDRKSANAVDCVELLEQRDVQVARDWTTLQQQAGARRATSVPSAAGQSLSNRVALDQQLDQRRAEKQEMLDKLLWANAYIVIYAIDDSASFNKAIKYLNLIDNNINSSQDSPKPLLATSGCERAPTCGAPVCSSARCTSHAASSNGCTSSSTSSQASVWADESGSCLGAPGISQSPQDTGGSSGGGGSSSSGCGCSTATQANARRPILLLANKCDLQKSQRQVSTKDGRMLAIRHQSMFAEVSIADTHRLLESCVTNLIEQIEPACLHRCQLAASTRSSSATTLTEWQPLACTQESALHHSGPRLGAPIWASLVKCAPLSGIVIQSSSSLIHSRVERAKPQVVATLRRFQQPRYSSGSEPVGFLPANAAKAHKENSYLDRYQSLKSSFKTKASIARNLTGARSHHNVEQVTPGALKSSSGDIQHHRAEFCEPISSRNKTTSWLRSHIRGSSSSSAQSGRKQQTIEGADACAKDDRKISVEAIRHKRPLFRYKNRRKTVAFETQVKPQESPAAGSGELELIDPTVQEATPGDTSGHAELSRTSDRSCPSDSLAACGSEPAGDSANSARAHSLQSSSSGYSSLEAPEKTHQSPSATCNDALANNASELEPAGVAHHPAANQQPETNSSGTCDRSAGCQRQPSGNVGKKRYHLVKTMQATLSNFTKSSSNPAQTQTQTGVAGAKRSFCNGLFSYGLAQSSAPVEKKVSQPALNLAKVEYIQRQSTTIGFCS